MRVTDEQIDKLLKDWALSTSPMTFIVRTETNNTIECEREMQDAFLDDLSYESIEIIRDLMSAEVPTEDIWDRVYEWYDNYCESTRVKDMVQEWFSDTDRYFDGKHISRDRADYEMCLQEGIFDLC